MSISYFQFKDSLKSRQERRQAYNPLRFTSVAKRALIVPSTYQQAHGPEALTDGHEDTFWQSTGTSPHHLSITLPRQVCVHRIEIDVNAEKDETFVPKEIDVYAGTNAHDLLKIGTENIPSKTGTYCLYITHQKRPLGVFELVIRSNNDFGRDSRIRRLEILVEKEPSGQLAEQESGVSRLSHRVR